MKTRSIVIALSVALVASLPTPAAPRSPVLPKCWGIITTGPGGGRILVCQNPCIGGGAGCTKVITDAPNGSAGITCKCQGGSTNCCDIWQMANGSELAFGDCETEECPQAGTCKKSEGGGGDVFARCN